MISHCIFFIDFCNQLLKKISDNRTNGCNGKHNEQKSKSYSDYKKLALVL